ncbi:uncharacterized protein LOC135345793 [Halichondria panicea]|uniref:uncharacterized protein LOC135345793 n=1 Tax=Halichondria panicea TaxID=6063 RepID=UPI00312B7706
MDSSSVKYQHFEPNREITPQSKKPKLSPVLVAVLILTCVALLITAVLAISIGVGISTTQQQQVSGLQNVFVSNNRLEGEYYGAQGSIHFQSTVNGTHFYYIVSTADGELIIMMVHPRESPMIMMEVNSTAFLLMKNEQGPNDEYVIPETSVGTMESVMMGYENMTTEILEKMDNKTVAKKSHDSLENLSMSPQAKLIIEAALALGNTGIKGEDSQAVMRFYVFALKLSNARASVETAPTTPSHSSKSSNLRQRRTVNCPANGAQCGAGQCPYQKYTNACFGMCGAGCTCWSFVCGDCCVHNFCETHDECCAQAGFFTFTCFSVAVEIFFNSCSDIFTC